MHNRPRYIIQYTVCGEYWYVLDTQLNMQMKSWGYDKKSAIDLAIFLNKPC